MHGRRAGVIRKPSGETCVRLISCVCMHPFPPLSYFLCCTRFLFLLFSFPFPCPSSLFACLSVFLCSVSDIVGLVLLLLSPNYFESVLFPYVCISVSWPPQTVAPRAVFLFVLHDPFCIIFVYCFLFFPPSKVYVCLVCDHGQILAMS